MSINLPVQTATEEMLVPIGNGQTLFVVGANGTGKSSLLLRFAGVAGRSARRISAGRQTWFHSSSVEITAAQKAQYEDHLHRWGMQSTSRYSEQNAEMRSGMTLYDLIDAENVDARQIASALRSGDLNLAQSLAAKVAPVAKINELLRLSNLSVEIAVEGGDKLTASRNGGPQYGAAELSDGERNALLIAADVLTARPGTLLIIDEPERHLHRSIISPLLTQLLRYRDDCAFVVATHDLMLPTDSPDARVLLVRSCTYDGSNAAHWDVDLIAENASLDEETRRDIVGARRRIVFVEGKATSLDEPLYSILFPGVSVRPKGTSRDVEHAVAAIRASEAVHWVQAWGIIDNDGRDPATIAELLADGIVALPFYSVESIYYHPDLIRAVALRHADVVGGDGEAQAQAAIAAGLGAVAPHLERLAARAAEKGLRVRVFASLPTLAQIEAKQAINLQIDTRQIVEAEHERLSMAAQANDWAHILTRCPVRETPALDAIARAIGLRNRCQYESAVLRMLKDDAATLATARSMFGTLEAELAAASDSNGLAILLQSGTTTA